jgi:hypothetical protein
MSKAWGHSVRKLTDEEIKKQIEMGENLARWYAEHSIEGRIPPTKEQCVYYERKYRISGKCKNESTHLLTYQYVTGRAGRSSYAEKPICEHHAEKYLVKTEGSTCR